MIRKWAWKRKEVNILQLVKGENVLDIGCGEGRIAFRLCNEGHKVTGIDILAKCTKNAKESGGNLQVVISDAAFLPFKDDIFDCCLFSEVLEHLTAPEYALIEAKRVLKDRGEIVALVPNDLNFFIARLFTLRFEDAFAERGHIRSFNQRSFDEFLTKHGKVIQRRGIPLNLPFEFSLLYAIKLAIRKR